MSAPVTVVVPVYNEAPFVEGVVESVVATLDRQGRAYEVLVLNDGSSDWSVELEQRLHACGPVRLRSFYPNSGKGATLNRAFPLLQDGLAVVIDADGEYAAADIPRVLAPLERDEADWVMGSRYGFDRPRPEQYLATWLVNRAVNAWFGLLSGIWLRDVLTGLYAFRTEVVGGLELHEARFSYTAELMWRLVHRGDVRRAEVPVSYRYRRFADGKKIRWWETGTILAAMLRYRSAPSRPRRRHGAA